VVAPSAVISVVPVIEELVVSAAPAIKRTVPPVSAIAGVVISKILVSAFVEVRVQVVTPEEFVSPQPP
jgi:hypothetical protein